MPKLRGCCHFGTWLPVLDTDGDSECVMEGIAAGIENSNNHFDEIYIIDERSPTSAACVFRDGLYQVPKDTRFRVIYGAPEFLEPC